jgi:aldehyde dehydrogenase (NAD+)
MKEHFIGARWTKGSAAESLPVIDPSTGEVVDKILRGTAADIDAAVQAARKAVDGGAWSRLTAAERGRLLSKLGVLVANSHEQLAQIESKDTGKPLAQSRNDITVLARYLEFYGGAADKHHGDVIPFLAGYHVSVLREPYGVSGHILPWNYPAQMFGRSLAPALAAGNAVVLKPSEDACLSALAIADLSLEAGFPPGAINIVTGLGEEAGAALSSHPGVDIMSFTGSPEVGTIVQKAAADNHTKVVLELGGKSPQVVFGDADLDRAVPIIVKAITQNAGQTCTAGSRLLVERSAWERVIGRVVEEFSKVRVGTPAMDLDCGPVINAQQRKRVEGFIRDAEAARIPVLARGRLSADLPRGGYWVTPTLFGPVPRTDKLACDEVFGPVLAAIPFEDEADAIALANGTEYGLIAGVWTSDGGRQIRMAKRIKAGQVFVNAYGAGGGVELPFGGVKRSGHGREKGFVALEEFSVLKTVVQYHGE